VSKTEKHAENHKHDCPDKSLRQLTSVYPFHINSRDYIAAPSSLHEKYRCETSAGIFA
jgi:hypothetical protein